MWLVHFSSAGTPDASPESQQPSPEEKKQALLMVLGILTEALKDESLSKDPAVRSAMEQLLSRVRGSQYLDHAAHHGVLSDMTGTREGWQYVKDTAVRHGAVAAREHGYQRAGVGHYEALARGLGNQGDMRLDSHTRGIELPSEGAAVDEIFAVVREAEKAYMREYTTILHKWGAIRKEVDDGRFCRWNQRQEALKRVACERKKEIDHFKKNNMLYCRFVDVRNRAERRTGRSYQEYKEQKRKENPPVVVRSQQRSGRDQLTPEEEKEVMRGRFWRPSAEYNAWKANREARLDRRDAASRKKERFGRNP